MDNQSAVADHPEVIRQQMEETRTSLTDKLETLEQTLKDTVTDATDAVSETVQSVKDAVQETVGTVKDTVQDTVASVKDTFDVASHVRERPWTMLLGATAIGFVGGKLLGGGSRPHAAPAAAMPGATLATSYPPAPAPAPVQAAPRPSWLERLAEYYGDELGKLKGLALATACGLVRDSIAASVTPAVGERITEVIDDLTTKMGSRPIPGPILAMPERPQPAADAPPTGLGASRAAASW